MTALGSMPLLNDYSLCAQAVTVYSFDGEAVTRTVHDRAYLDFKKTENVDRTGSSESNSFLLVIPGSTLCVHVGDKVVLGEGPNVPVSDVKAWWRSFIPAKVDNLVVVKHVDTKYWNGQLVHTEAGG